MSQGLNKVYLLGHLGDEPELRFTKSGEAVLNFSLATNESYVDRHGARKELTHWHRAVVWGKRGEALAKYLHKGSRVMVEGGLRTRSWEGADGTKRFATEVVARELILLSSRTAPSTLGAEEPAAPLPEFDFGGGDEERGTAATGPLGAQAAA